MNVGVLVFEAIVVSQVFLEVVGMALGIEDLEERVVVVGSIVDVAAGFEGFQSDGEHLERHDEEKGLRLVSGVLTGLVVCWLVLIFDVGRGKRRRKKTTVRCPITYIYDSIYFSMNELEPQQKTLKQK